MSPPLCPVHKTAMRAGRAPGSFFCPQSTGVDENGEKTWCSERVAPPKPDKPAASTPAAAAGKNGASIPVACLDFAGRVFQGSGAQGSLSALELAKAAYMAFKEAL